MADIKIKDAERIRENLTRQQEREISALYRRVQLEARHELRKIPKNGTVTDSMRASYLRNLEKQLVSAYESLGAGLERKVKQNMSTMAQSVVNDINSNFSSGRSPLQMQGAFSHVPKDIVEALATGQVYDNNWTLSGAIWSDVKHKQKDIERIVAQGVAGNRSAYDIAKDLETYVDPAAKKPWDWSKVYPGTSKKIDYNAQRLARTMVSHAYQQSLVRVCKDNPFVEGFIWQSAHSHRTCQLCLDRDGQFYTKDELPVDHPNGMCTYIAHIPKSMTEVADDLADWVQGASNPALDKWAVSGMRQKVVERHRADKAALAATYATAKAGTAKHKQVQRAYKDKLEGLPAEQLAAVRAYTSGDAYTINEFLRTGDYAADSARTLDSKKAVEDAAKALEKAITGIPCPSNLTVYRRVDSLGEIVQFSFADGQYKARRFLSSTMDKEHYKAAGKTFSQMGDVELRIKVPKGYTGGAYIGDVSTKKQEYEFLFTPGAKFDIVSMTDKTVTLLAKN